MRVVRLPRGFWLSWRTNGHGIDFDLARHAAPWSGLHVSWAEALAVAWTAGVVVGVAARFLVDALG